MEAGTAVQMVQSPSTPINHSSSHMEDQSTVTTLRSTEMPDLSLLTGMECASKVGDTFSEPPYRGEGKPIEWKPVVTPINGDGTPGQSLSMESVDEMALLRSEMKSLRLECTSLKKKNDSLERERRQVTVVHDKGRTEFLKRIQTLERENDDYLRCLVSSNSKAEFFEKSLRETRLRCQEYEDILRQHGLFPGADGQPIAASADPSADSVSVLKGSSNQLQSLLTAQRVKLNKLVQQSSSPRSPLLGASNVIAKPTSLPCGSHLGAREKTPRPVRLSAMETSQQAWPPLSDARHMVDAGGTKPWVGADQPRGPWVPDEGEITGKQEWVSNWIRDLPRPEMADQDDKDYVIVPTSPDLPTTNPNSGCRTFPRRREPWKTADTRGSMAPVHPAYEATNDGSNRRCIVCFMEFDQVISTDEYENHVADCCEQASARDVNSPPPQTSPHEQKCPVCSGDYSSTSQQDFISHVDSHFDDDQTEGAAALAPAPVLDHRA